MDVLTNWKKVVEVAKESTVIFNMIDTGEYLDLAFQSLAYMVKAHLVNEIIFN